MAVINYQNISISVNGTILYATSASFSFETPIEPIRSLGQRNAVANVITGPVQGSLDINYVITNASDPGKIIFENIKNGTYTASTVIIGGRSFSAYLTNHSLSAEPNSIIEASLSFDVFDIPNFADMISSSAGTAVVSTVAHGSNSSIDSLVDAISFEYTASVEWEPIYILQADEPERVIFRGAEQRVTLRGPNAGQLVSRCVGQEDVTFSIGSLCGSTLFTISIQDSLITSTESSVEAGGIVEGSYEIVRFY